MKTTKMVAILVLALGLIFSWAKVSYAASMGTAFTYQGHLYDANNIANGLYDFQFRLYDANVSGIQIGCDVNVPDVDVIDGYFTVDLDFGGSVFDGDGRWLEIGVRPGDQDDPNIYTPLTPLQKITPAPYALYAASAPGGSIIETDPTVPASVKDGISWYEVNSRPAGLDDGDDNTQLSEGQVDSYVSNNGYLNSSSSLNWNNLISVPAGFADGVDDVGGGSLWSQNGSNIYYNSGNVGIGVTSPTYKLDVYGAGGLKVTETGGADTIFTVGTLGETIWSYGGNEFARIDADAGPAGILQLSYVGTPKVLLHSSGNSYFNAGNVGIGTTSPAAKLDVSGDISASSVYKIGGNTVLSAPGTQNTFVGIGAGAVNTGYANTFLGNNAGYSNTTGNSNTFSGWWAGYFNTTGNENTFLGLHAGYKNTTGTYNTFSGNGAGYSNTTGNSNTFLGLHAGYKNTTGNYNTFSGYDAGCNNTTGWNNTFSGNLAGYYTTGSGNVFLGNAAGFYETGSNKLYIDNSNTTTPLIHGDFATNRVGINRVSTANTLEVGGNASKSTAGSWLANSDARIKTDIQTVNNALDTLDKVRLVSFKYTDDYRSRHQGIEDRAYLNVVAQEFAEVFPNYVQSSGEKLPDSEEILQVDSYPLTIYTAAAVQELHENVNYTAAAVQELHENVKELKAENESLKQRLESQEKVLQQLQAVVMKGAIR